MRKIPGLGGLKKNLSVAIGNYNRSKFINQINCNISTILSHTDQMNPIDMEVASISSSNLFAEQILSILSFLRYVGIPIKWTLYSDGSYSNEQIEELEKRFIFLKVINWINLKESQSSYDLCKEELLPYHEYLYDYAKKSPFGKKLFYYLNHSIVNPTLFIDADILFYHHANILKLILTEKPKANGWFMPDINWECLDSRYKEKYSEQLYQVNAGFIFANVAFSNLNDSLDILKSFNYSYEHFSEQTIFHHLLKTNFYMPLTSKKFILNTGDQFKFSYLLKPKKMAIRHYTGPVRHKMWQKDYKWHLNLKK
jgi:hypothetical protein